MRLGKHAHTAQRHLRSFQKELADADERLGVSLDIGGFATFADYFFDGLIADWIMQSKIESYLRPVPRPFQGLDRFGRVPQETGRGSKSYRRCQE